MEFKVTLKQLARRVKIVDIGTEWNLKSISEVDGKVEIALI